jgi:hypothetical protein
MSNQFETNLESMTASNRRVMKSSNRRSAIAATAFCALAVACSSSGDGSVGNTSSASTAGQSVSAPRGSGVISPQVSTPTPSQLPTYGNGPVLSAPQVIPVYWGTFAAGQVASMQAYMTGLTDYLTNSGETTVRQYGVNSASVVASYSDPFVPVSSIARGDVENEIRALISAGSVPAPGAQTVYMVMTGGIAFNDGYGSSYCGYHQYAHPGALASGPSFAYALNPNPYTTNCGEGGWDGLSQVQAWEGQISHELQEAATDPQPFSGWTP